MANKLAMILTSADMARFKRITDDSAIIDLHGLGCKEMKRFIRNVCALYKTSADITLIHGYRHGTDLLRNIRTDKNLILKDFTVEAEATNPGVSILHIA